MTLPFRHNRMPAANCGATACRGYTLIETMVVIAIIGILLGIGVPALRDYLVATRLSSEANGLVADILRARSEAARRGRHIVVCPSTNQTQCCPSSACPTWSDAGRIVFVDLSPFDGTVGTGETVIHTVSTLPAGYTMVASGFPNNSTIPFSPYGGLLPAGSSGTFKLCGPSGAGGRQIRVDINGRPNVTIINTCP